MRYGVAPQRLAESNRAIREDGLAVLELTGLRSRTQLLCRPFLVAAFPTSRSLPAEEFGRE